MLITLRVVFVLIAHLQYRCTQCTAFCAVVFYTDWCINKAAVKTAKIIYYC